jgi:sugar phosphate isomerase/epimerase
MTNPISYRAGTLETPNLPWDRVAAAGVQGIELLWSDGLTAAAAEAVLAPHGLPVTSLSVMCKLADDGMPDLFGRVAAVAADLGATYLFTSAKRDEMPLAEAADRLRRIGDATGAHGVAVALETHPDLCTHAEEMAQTMAAVQHEWIGVNYDTANVYYYNHDIDTVEQAAACVQHVKGVHFKDGHGGYHDFDFPVFGEGIVPFDKVHEVFRQAGYSGPYCMELEGPAFDRDKPDELAGKVAACVSHLRGLGIGA